MHPRIDELLTFIDTQRGMLTVAVESVPVGLRGQPPEPDRWSVADVLEHLATVESRITNMFKARLAEARTAGIGLEADASPILESLNLDQIVDRTNRLNPPNAMKSGTGGDATATLAKLVETRRGFREAVLDADGLALNEITHPHLFFGPFTLYKWIGFVGAHEARHASQIREIGESLSGSNG